MAGDDTERLDLTSLRARFREPSPAFSPVPLWWWSGDTLDPARLRWQLERFVQGGVYNLVVMNLAPSGPLYGADADDPPFFSDDWWTIFLGVCADARELGVRLWFYDQIGFSGANIQGHIIHAHPHYAGRALDRLTVDASSPTALTCPPGGEPLAAWATRLDDAGEPSGAPTPLTIDGNGVVGEGAGSPHRVSLAYAVERGFDYLDPAACATLLDTIHGEFERRAGGFFGDVIVGSFQDELPTLPSWSPAFAVAFSETHGYNPVPLLRHLWEPDGSHAGRTFRRDYHATRAKLSEAAFFRPLFDWHESRGLLCGVDQQGPARAGAPLSTVSIYADYLRTHRWYGAPGSDHHGEAKLHSSLAHLYGRPRVWIEAFHSSGWGSTLEETFDWLLPWLRAGANLYDPHATYYSTRGGWFEWAPPATDWRQPYWRHYRVFAEAVARLCQVLSAGRHRCDLGVLFPTATIQAGAGLGPPDDWATAAHECYLRLVGRMVWFNQDVGELDRLTLDYDVLDDDSVVRAEVHDGALEVAGERYSVIVLPGCAVLEAATAERLAKFVAGGGRLIAVGALPIGAAGTGDAAAVDRLRAYFLDGTAYQIAAPAALGEALRDAPRLCDADVPTLVRQVGDVTVVFVPARFPRASDVSIRGGTTIRFDPNDYPRTKTVRIRGVSGPPEVWEPFSGAQHQVVDWRPLEDGVEATLSFDDGPGVLLVWSGDQTKPNRRAAEPSVTELADTWRVALESTLDNRWGDFAMPPSATVPYARWTVEHRVEPPGQALSATALTASAADDTGWAPVVATFGPHGWLAGPDGPEALRELADPVSDPSGWRTAVYSTSRGIHKDPLHRGEPIGPSGHVPEEFLFAGRLQPGEAVRFRTVVHAGAAMRVHLAVGAPAAKQIWLNGTAVTLRDRGYLAQVPVELVAGPNDLDVLFIAEDEGDLRASVSFVTHPDRFVRPQRLVAGDAPQRDTHLRFTADVSLSGEVERGTIQVAAGAPCRLVVNGREVGRQGGYMPYGDLSSIYPYDVTAFLRPGGNEVACEMDDPGRSVTVLVDGVVETSRGATVIVSDDTWAVHRDGVPVPLDLARRHKGDPARSFWRQRPHPLPEARWLEGAASDDGTVLPLTMSPRRHGRREWLRFTLPPGATAMTLPLRGAATAWVDDAHLSDTGDLAGAGWRLDLPAGDGTPRTCVIRVQTVPGFEGGAVLRGPIAFELGEGVMPLGDWQELGLTDFSGAVHYRQRLDVPPDRSGARKVWLDLGTVRGTAEVFIGGQSAGVRVLAPYRFDVTDLAASGDNELEIVVTNTLAPYLDAVSPTPFVFPGQTVSGLFGPVRVLVDQD